MDIVTDLLGWGTTGPATTDPAQGSYEGSYTNSSNTGPSYPPSSGIMDGVQSNTKRSNIMNNPWAGDDEVDMEQVNNLLATRDEEMREEAPGVMGYEVTGEAIRGEATGNNVMWEETTEENEDEAMGDDLEELATGTGSSKRRPTAVQVCSLMFAPNFT
jgi:hypothetical protein